MGTPAWPFCVLQPDLGAQTSWPLKSLKTLAKANKKNAFWTTRAPRATKIKSAISRIFKRSVLTHECPIMFGWIMGSVLFNPQLGARGQVTSWMKFLHLHESAYNIENMTNIYYAWAYAILTTLLVSRHINGKLTMDFQLAIVYILEEFTQPCDWRI